MGLATAGLATATREATRQMASNAANGERAGPGPATRARQELLRCVGAQGVMAVLAVVAAWVVAGSAASVSALVGAGAYWVPNTLFMLWLLAGIRYAGQASPYIFLLGEACKLGMTVLVLGLVVWFGREQIVWPALLAGLLCALKGHVLLLMLGKLP